MLPFPEPTAPGGRAQVLTGYLAYFRSVVADRLDGLSVEQQSTSRLPSGWTPRELVVHLLHVERRWLEWGFEGREVGDPWADERDGRWYAAPDVDVLALLAAQAERTAAVVARHALDEVGAPGARWDGAPPPTLERVLLHLVQEYARHAGHLDVVRELLDGRRGE